MEAQALTEAASSALAPPPHVAAMASSGANASPTDESPAAPAVSMGLADAAATQLASKVNGSPSGSAVHGEGKKTGRPVHPLWAHFHRGEKRNRYHYHAFCVYCVARLGLAQAAPTRGVSTDMLRHLEGCAYCPREIVEQVKDMCERRERTAAAHSNEQQRASPSTRHRKKTAAPSQGGANVGMSAVEGDDTGAAMTSLLGGVDMPATTQGVDVQDHEPSTIFSPGKPDGGSGTSSADAVGATTMEQVLQQSMDESPAPTGNMSSRSEATASIDPVAAVAMSPSLLGSSQPLQQHGSKRSSEDMLDGSAAMVGAFTTPTRKKRGHARSFDLASPVEGEQQHTMKGSRRSEDDSRDDGEWVASVLKTVVASNLPLSVLQRLDFQALLQYIHPTTARPDGTTVDIAAMFDDQRIVEAARKLAIAQLDRVKEGMLNSTIIKGGLTLSINCWSTLDLQHLVAFSLLNSNGDAACVRVVDMGNHVNAYTSPKLAMAIEDVLDQLGREQQISVMGIVADSVVALNAARRVCRAPKWASLLVVPCVSAVLSTLAGSIFTHSGFHEAVGDLIDIASYFSNPALLTVLREVSGVRDAFIPLPRHDNWYSIVVCLGAMLEYADVITAVCVGSTRAAAEEDSDNRTDDGTPVSSPAPQSLVELVVADNGVIWKTLRDMERVLAPLREAYSVVTTQQQHHQQHAGQKLKTAQGNAGADSSDDPAVDEPFPYSSTGCSAGGGIQSGLTLAHVMHQFGRMSQQYAIMVQANAASDALASSPSSPPLSSTALGVAELMQTLVDTLWRRYDLPAMVLAYVFDFHLDASVLNFSHPLLEWKAVALYFQRYFHRWFTSDSLTATSAATQSLNLTNERAAVILNAYQLRQFPFDPATTSDYTDVSSFYSFVSDSHPEICALCCRLYALGLGSANVRSIIRGVGVVPPIAQTIEPPGTVELLLHIGFAASLKKCLPPPNDQATSLVHGEASAHAGQELLLCSAGEWASFALEWRHYLDHELAMDEFEQLSQMTSGADGNGRNGSSGGVREESMAESLRHLKLSLEQTFVRKLPPLVNATFIADTGEDNAGVSTQHPSAVLL
jgi:hypothetical protein